jgi:hypothetical protein
VACGVSHSVLSLLKWTLRFVLMGRRVVVLDRAVCGQARGAGAVHGCCWVEVEVRAESAKQWDVEVG